MNSDDRDDLLADVADAVTRDHDVEWDRCSKLAAPEEREKIENLELVARVFRSRRHAGQTPGSRLATSPEPHTGTFVRRVIQVLIGITTVQVAVTLLLLPWKWGDFHGQHGEVAVFFVTMLAGHAASGYLLLFAGLRDSRTWLLGLYFLLNASLPSLHLLMVFLGELPPPHMIEAFLWELPTTTMLVGILYVPVFLFAPAFLWAFAREFPRVHRRIPLDDLARRMIPVSVAIGFAAWAAGWATLAFAQAGYAGTPVTLVLDGILVTIDLLELGAAVVVALRANTASASEMRRVIVFSTGFVIYLGVAILVDVAEAFRPGLWASNYQRSPAILLMELMRFPGMILLWYSVLSVRVPHPMEVVRESYRRVLVRLDSWIFPEAMDQRQALADAGAALAQAGRMMEVGRTAARTVNRGCGSPAILLIAADSQTEAPFFQAPAAGVAPLPRSSAIIHLLETAGGPLRVHPKDGKSVFALLPRDEKEWIVETSADVILPLAGMGTEVVGVLVVGCRSGDRLTRAEDLPFLEAIGAAAGLAVARLRLQRMPEAPPSEALPAQECPVCRCVVEAGAPPDCECGADYEGTGVPKRLAGKFRLTRRLGAGGMGAVYLARDLRLARDVAIKTLGRPSDSHLVGLRPEAWTMATVTHPAAAQIHGIEIWQGRPFLIVEFLPGGTLEDRLRDGPLPPLEAVTVIGRLADALATLHEKGFLHGDIKPSNIGFTSDGSAKLLDFGLARETDDAATVGGTLLYLSPEVLSGRLAGKADDVWSLCVVLYEMVSGRHPFAATTINKGVERHIRQQRLANVAEPPAASKTGSTVIGFAASILTAPRPARPEDARVLAEALSKVARDE